MNSDAALPRSVIRSQRVYYGWIVLSVAALAMVATLPGRTQGLGLITRPLLAELRWSEVSFARVNLVATLLGALFTIPVGYCIDRFGVRATLTAALAALGAVVLAMTGASSATALFIAITLTRGLGQSALSVVSLATVGKWFSRRVSLAMGVYSLALGFGFVAAFPGVQYAVERAGWRPAWAGVGYGVIALAPVAWLIVRNGPERYGLTLENVSAIAADREDARGLTLREALATPAFWAYSLGSALYALVASGVSLLNELMLAERGFGSATFRLALVVTALSGISSNFVGGWLGQRYSLPRVLAVGLALFAPCLALFTIARTELQIVFWALGMGATGGVVTVVFFAIWSRHFGRAHLGSIQSAAQAMTVFASAIGPELFAETKSRAGSYAPMFYATTALSLLLALACWFVRAPDAQRTRAS